MEDVNEVVVVPETPKTLAGQEVFVYIPLSELEQRVQSIVNNVQNSLSLLTVRTSALETASAEHVKNNCNIIKINVKLNTSIQIVPFSSITYPMDKQTFNAYINSLSEPMKSLLNTAKQQMPAIAWQQDASTLITYLQQSSYNYVIDDDSNVGIVLTYVNTTTQQLSNANALLVMKITDALSKEYVDNLVDPIAAVIPDDASALNVLATENFVASEIQEAMEPLTTIVPEDAASDNPLVTESTVDSKINENAAYWITLSPTVSYFPSRTALVNATVYYSGGQPRVPTRNDYAYVQEDEYHDFASTKYVYDNGWQFQVLVNETPLSESELDALRSGATQAKINQIASNTAQIASNTAAIATKSSVSVSMEGTATDEIKYITVDGVQKRVSDGSHFVLVEWS